MALATVEQLNKHLQRQRFMKKTLKSYTLRSKMATLLSVFFVLPETIKKKKRDKKPTNANN